MRAPVAIAILGLVASCIGTTPEEELADQQGDDPYEDGPTHRPGQRCLACHGEDYTPGGEVFVVAGTAFRRADDALGLAGVEIEITDDRGAVFTVTSNQTGNFMVSVGEVDEERRGQGWIGRSEAPVFPLRVLVRYAGAERIMRNVIHREGSCAACHDRHGKGAASNGKLFVEKTP
jgi:mono/diheme cytochrome c family protein